jgi:hypothetical protein
MTLKQRLTAARLHQQLISKGCRVSACLLRSYLRERRSQRQEVYILLIHRPDEEAQVDFFE